MTLLLLVHLALAAAPPPPDLGEEADVQFGLGVRALQDGDYDVALAHLLASNRLSPNKNVIFNIARCYEQLGQYTDAWRHYADYVAVESDPAERKPALDAMARIQKQVALVSVETDPPGAALYIDRKDLGVRGATPRVLALPAGKHKIYVELAGFEEPQAVEVQADNGKTTLINVPLTVILGRVQLDGGPAGAEVRVDNREGPVVGTLPAQLALPPGAHVLYVSASGYQPAAVPVEVNPRELTPTAANLVPITGTVVIDAPERGSIIEVDGVSVGFTPAVLPIRVGAHRLRVSRSGYVAWEGDVSAIEGQEVHVDARLRPYVEVSAASRSAQAVEDAPGSVSVVSGDEIRAFGYQSVYEALNGVRGLYQTYDRSYQYIGFRGISRLQNYNNRQLMTLDGHTLNDDQLGASYYGRDLATDLHSIERIEVVRGPGSALYGTNAFSGVVNLVTRDEVSMERPHVSVALSGEREGRVNAGWSAAPNATTGVWLSAGAVYGQGDDYTFPELATEENPTGVSVGADSTKSATFLGRGRYKSFTVEGYYNSRRKQVATGAYDSLLADPRTQVTDSRGALELRLEPKFGIAQVLARVYLDHYQYNGTFAYADDEVSSAQWDGTWFGTDDRLVLKPVRWFQLTVGGEARIHGLAHLRSCTRTNTESRSCDGDSVVETYLDTHPSYQIYSAYGVADLDTRYLSAEIGGRFDYFSTFGGTFNPRAALIGKPSDRDRIKLLGGTAYRAPSAYELYFEDGHAQLPAENLQPETIKSAELEYSHRFGDALTLLASVYYNDIDSVIDTEDVGDEQFRFANTAGELLTAGAEAELRREWLNGTMFAASYSLQRTRTALFTSPETLNSPEHLASLKIAFPIGPARLANKLVAESVRLTEAGEHTAPVLLWDATATGTLPDWKLDWAVGIRNVLDWQYTHPSGPDVTMEALPEPGRTLYVELTRSL